MIGIHLLQDIRIGGQDERDFVDDVKPRQRNDRWRRIRTAYQVVAGTGELEVDRFRNRRVSKTVHVAF